MSHSTFHVYILTNGRNGTLCVGVTSDLARRLDEHRTAALPSFTKRYGLTKLVYCEAYDDPESAILREKRLKKWNRAWKLALIEKENPRWNDLSETLNW